MGQELQRLVPTLHVFAEACGVDLFTPEKVSNKPDPADRKTMNSALTGELRILTLFASQRPSPRRSKPEPSEAKRHRKPVW